MTAGTPDPRNGAGSAPPSARAAAATRQCMKKAGLWAEERTAVGMPDRSVSPASMRWRFNPSTSRRRPSRKVSKPSDGPAPRSSMDGTS